MKEKKNCKPYFQTSQEIYKYALLVTRGLDDVSCLDQHNIVCCLLENNSHHFLLIGVFVASVMKDSGHAHISK